MNRASVSDINHKDFMNHSILVFPALRANLCWKNGKSSHRVHVMNFFLQLVEVCVCVWRERGGGGVGKEFSVPEWHAHIGCWTCIKTLISLHFHVFARLNKSTNLQERLYMTFKKKPSTRGELNLRKQTRANKARLVVLGFQGKI